MPDSNFTLDDHDDDIDNVLVDLGGPPPQPQAPSPPSMPPMPPMPPPPPHMMMMDPSSGTYHPDFMFCGECATCQEPDPNKAELDEEEKLETYMDSLISLEDANIVILKTKFQLRQPLGNASHSLVIQSLLQPLPGVARVVVNVGENSVSVTSTIRILIS